MHRHALFSPVDEENILAKARKMLVSGGSFPIFKSPKRSCPKNELTSCKKNFMFGVQWWEQTVSRHAFVSLDERNC